MSRINRRALTGILIYIKHSLYNFFIFFPLFIHESKVQADGLKISQRRVFIFKKGRFKFDKYSFQTFCKIMDYRQKKNTFFQGTQEYNLQLFHRKIFYDSGIQLHIYSVSHNVFSVQGGAAYSGKHKSV